MIITVELEDEDFKHLYDVIFEALYYDSDVDYNNNNLNSVKIKKIWDNLPTHVTSTAIQWGTSDSVFRDDMYVELENNKDKYLKLLSRR